MSHFSRIRPEPRKISIKALNAAPGAEGENPTQFEIGGRLVFAGIATVQAIKYPPLSGTADFRDQLVVGDRAAR
jgi:hypothetical protein